MTVPQPYIYKLNKYKAVALQLPYYPWSPQEIEALTEDEREYYLTAIRKLRADITKGQ